jgi:hypothetical protein
LPARPSAALHNCTSAAASTVVTSLSIFFLFLLV